METSNNPSQPSSTPHHPQATSMRGAQPLSRRPMIDGFAPRRSVIDEHRPQPLRTVTPQAPASTHPRPATLAASTPGQHTPQAYSASTVQPHHTTVQAKHVDFTSNQRAFDPRIKAAVDSDTQSIDKIQLPKERSQTGHAGLVGFIAFLVFGALLLTPLLPGKVTQNFPLASSTFSTGNQSLDCLGAQGKINNATTYTSRVGTPLTYSYATNTSQSALCEGQMQSAVISHTSQFNPLGLAIDVLLSIALAVITAYVWRLLFGEKRHKVRRHEV